MRSAILSEINERLGRFRWLQWTNVIFWGLLGSFGCFYLPRLDPIFASFGSDLPASTRILLRARPFFMVAFGTAVISAACLKLKPRENPIGRRRRLVLWVSFGAALLGACWTVSAVFAPMFMGSLAESPSYQFGQRR